MPSSIHELFEGGKITIRYQAGLHDTAGNPAHAATFIRRRVIVLDPGLKARAREHRRILLHEYFHFVWVKLGNQRRRAWEAYLASEWHSGGRGEAGWSAEWRKRKLPAGDVAKRSRLWREYCCESFCDTAAWITGGADSEVTLGEGRRSARRAWFRELFHEQRFPV